MTKEQTILMELGVPANQRGFSYLTTALELAQVEPIYADHTIALYEKLAVQYATKPTRIERCIRHAIETAFTTLEPAQIEKFFGHSITAKKGKPVNSAFIATMALWLKGDGEA